MIIRVKKDSGEIAFLPLVLDPDLDAWRPLSEETYATPMEAAKACHEVLRKQWEVIVLSARKLRALVEHPEFQEFEADGISSELIRDEARNLTGLMQRRWTDFVHLLDETTDIDPDLDAWRPLSEETYATPMEAAKACHEALRKQWEVIVLSARKLRALVEHPEFQEFEADGISGEIIRDEAQNLTGLMERRWTDFVRLLDEPTNIDFVLLPQEQREQDSNSQTPDQSLKHAVENLVGSLANFSSSNRQTRAAVHAVLKRLKEEEQASETEQAIDSEPSGKGEDE